MESREKEARGGGTKSGGNKERRKERRMQRKEEKRKTKRGHNEVEMKSRGKKEINRRKKTSDSGCKSKNQ